MYMKIPQTLKSQARRKEGANQPSKLKALRGDCQCGTEHWSCHSWKVTSQNEENHVASQGICLM